MFALSGSSADFLSAYCLIAHGSCDPRSQHSLETCADLVRQQLSATFGGQPLPMVGVGQLEFGDRPLAEQIAIFANQAAQNGVKQVFLVPLFLMSGNHVNQDLPDAVRLAQQTVSADLELVLCPHVGSHPGMAALIRSQMEPVTCDRWILLAHGTRRPGGNQSIEDLAQKLGAMSAYWAIEPKLEDRLQSLGNAAPQRVGIVPYFLFTGSIMDAIQAEADRLRSRLPELHLQFTQPINPSALLSSLLLDCVSLAQSGDRPVLEASSSPINPR